MEEDAIVVAGAIVVVPADIIPGLGVPAGAALGIGGNCPVIWLGLTDEEVVPIGAPAGGASG